MKCTIYSAMKCVAAIEDGKISGTFCVACATYFTVYFKASRGPQVGHYWHHEHDNLLLSHFLDIHE